MLSPWQISIPLDVRERKTRVTKKPSRMMKPQSLIGLQDSPCEKYGIDMKRKQERRKSLSLPVPVPVPVPVPTWCRPRIADLLPSVNDERRYTPTRYDLAVPRILLYKVDSRHIKKQVLKMQFALLRDSTVLAHARHLQGLARRSN